MSERPAVKMTFVDRAIAFVSPAAAVRRLTAKERLHEFRYNERPWERGSSGGMSRNGAGEPWHRQRDRLDAMWDARDLVQHDWIGSILWQLALYVVGELECKSATGDPEYDTLYDDYFHAWCGDSPDDDGGTPCDITGRHRFIKLIQLAFVEHLVDGDFGFVQRETLSDDDTPRISLQCVEADRLGSPLDAAQSETYIGGITIDPETGRPVSFRVYRRTRAGQYTDPREIPPHDFIHLWDPERTDHYRGMSALLRLLEDCRDLRETQDGEKIAIKDQTQFAGAITTKDPYQSRGAGAWEGKTTEGTPTQKAVWGKWLKFTEGESASFLTPSSRPSGATMAFWQLLIRKMAKSLKVSYEFLWDMSPLGGVTSRVVVRGDERRFTYWQRLLVDRVLRRVRKVVLAYGVTHDGLPAHPAMGQCAWHFGERVITDAGYEVQNDITMMEHGIVAWDDVATKYSRGGGDLLDIFRRNAGVCQGAQQITTETRIPPEAYAPALLASLTQQLAAINTPPEEATPPPPAPGSLQAVGDKGAAQIVDLLTKVATGQIDPETARQTLVTVYGLQPDQAAQIVPARRPGDDTAHPPA